MNFSGQITQKIQKVIIDSRPQRTYLINLIIIKNSGCGKTAFIFIL